MTTRPSAPCAPSAPDASYWLLAGSDVGGETFARATTLVETAKLNGADPQAHLAHPLGRIPDHKITRLDEPMPWHRSA